MENLKKAIALKDKLDALRPLKVEDELRIMQKFRFDWNFHSNNLEGNSLTYGETKALILFGITAQGKPFRDSLETSGHNEAIDWILEVIKQKRPLTEKFIRELHALILQKPYEVDAITPDGQPTKKLIQIGKYKTTPNHVKTKTGEIFRFATPEETPSKMGDLMQWLKEKSASPEFYPILIAAEFHYRFIRIHPFDDGNGRTARILMNFILMSYAYPPVVIKTEDKENYFAVLQLADAGNIEPFTEYISQNLIRSLKIMIAGANGESIEEADDLDKEILLMEQRLKGVASKIEIFKSPEIITDIIGDIKTKIIDDYLKKSKKLSDLYVDFVSHQKINMLFDDEILHNGNFQSIVNCYDFIFDFMKFRYDNFDFNYQSKISFKFNEKFYSVFSSGSEILRKKYSEQLTDDEINLIVKAEVRKHKEFIDQQIDEHKKQNP